MSEIVIITKKHTSWSLYETFFRSYNITPIFLRSKKEFSYSVIKERCLAIFFDFPDLGFDEFRFWKQISETLNIPVLFVNNVEKTILAFTMMINQGRIASSSPFQIGNHVVQINNDILFDQTYHLIRKHDRVISLSNVECKLLTTLCTKINVPYRTQDLLNDVWGYHAHVGLDSLYVYIRKLREKIEENPSNPTILITHHRFGYELKGNNTSAGKHTEGNEFLHTIPYRCVD